MFQEKVSENLIMEKTEVGERLRFGQDDRCFQEVQVDGGNYY